jgi:hypothetical protein
LFTILKCDLHICRQIETSEIKPKGEILTFVWRRRRRKKKGEEEEEDEEYIFF